MINYEAATKYAVKFFQGDRASEREIPPHIAAGVRKIIDAALGDLERQHAHSLADDVVTLSRELIMEVSDDS